MGSDRFKFRVFDKTVNRYFQDEEFCINCSGSLVIQSEFDGDSLRDMDDFIIEQCTGFRDMDGKLVYEGDVLLDRDNRLPHIYFSRGYGRFMLDYGDNEDGQCTVQATMSNIADMSVQYSINTPKL